MLPRSAWLLLPLTLFACAANTGADSDDTDTDALDAETAKATSASVGKLIFFDPNLSDPPGQSCSTCHDPAHAYADPRPGPTSEGAVKGRFGFRNSPSIVYSSFTPVLGAAGDETGFSGGLFLDGRVPTLETQVESPLLNPLEMNNADRAAVVAKIKASHYAKSFKKVFGKNVFNDVDTAFEHIGDAIAAFERTGIAKRFTSKYDAFLAGKVKLTDSETRGLALFEDEKRGNCASCHIDKPGDDGSPPLFTDFGYDNLGIPKNPANPFYTLPPELNPNGANFVDHGLSAAIINPRQDGKFKAQTLRNIALTAPYGHNGYFPTLKSIVDFYNTRDVRTAHWDAPEVRFDLNVVDMGNLGLSDQDVADVVAFLETLTDGFKVPH